MLRRRQENLRLLALLIDAVGALLSLTLTFLFLKTYGGWWEDLLQSLTGYPFQIQPVTPLLEYGWVFVLLFAHMMGALLLVGFYHVDPFAGVRVHCLKAALGILAGLAATALFLFFFQLAFLNRSFVFLFGLGLGGFVLVRAWLFQRLLHARDRRRAPLQVVLITSEVERPAREAEMATRRLPRMHRHRFFAVEAAKAESLTFRQQLADSLSRDRVDLILLSGVEREVVEIVTEVAAEQGVDVWFLPGLPPGYVGEPINDDWAGHPLWLLQAHPAYQRRFLIKRVFDLWVALGLGLLLLPLGLLLAFGIKVTSRGPVFFRQQRTGYQGKPFTMWKFRTMVTGAEAVQAEVVNEQQGPAFKNKTDPRVTPFGRWLRRTSLDELPQLINVLKGEMSLVGPRPLPVAETARLPAFRDHRRYRVLPGLTGLWQVSGRSSIQDFDEWVRLDLEYIDRWSFWLDLRILAKTLPAVWQGDGAH